MQHGKSKRNAYRRFFAQKNKKGLAYFAKPLFCMAHSGGFEPPTARFVAEYSIQLSYECVEARILCSLPISVKKKFLRAIDFCNLKIKSLENAQLD